MKAKTTSRRRSTTPALEPAAAAPPERRGHDALFAELRIDRDRDGRELKRSVGLRVATQTPLDRYLSQGHVSPEQWWGGDLLRADFERGSFEIIARSRWDSQPSGGSSDFASVSLAACAARRDYVKAIDALPGRLSPVIIHVCCLRGYAADWAIAKALPRGDGMALLRLGLDLLADHYEKAKGLRPDGRANVGLVGPAASRTPCGPRRSPISTASSA